MLSNFKKLYLIRFISYSLIVIGFLATIFQFGPTALAEFNYRKDQLLRVRHQAPPVVIGPDGESLESGDLSSLKDPTEKIIRPVSTDYGIVIEKINANAKVIENVDPGSEREYTNALAKGVAEAKGSTKPGQVGNLFIFSHSADAPWNISRFNAIFYLLRELESGDRIIVYYQGKRYDYTVFDKAITKPEDLSFLTNRYDKPVLTLQTCDPPGTLLNRLVVRARLAGS